MEQYYGYFAALGTSILFALTSTMFTLAGRKVGAPVVNRTRLLLALLFISVLHTLLFGLPFPANGTVESWFWFGVSGLIGLAIGDAFLFQSFVMVGPRLGMLMMALAPVLSLLFAAIFLQEVLSPQQVLGVFITVIGIGWVVTDRNESKRIQIDKRVYFLGLACGFGAAVGQALGLVLAKVGLEGGMDPLSGLWIRIFVAGLIIWVYTIFRGKALLGFRMLREKPEAMKFMLVGAFAGPFIGVWLSLISVQTAPVGIASTLIALTPIFLLPISLWVFKDPLTFRSVVGTLIAIVGIALIFI